MGASFIKLAQVLATRSDFFSKEYLDELKELHDKLPKMSKSDFEDVFKICERSIDGFIDYLSSLNVIIPPISD